MSLALRSELECRDAAEDEAETVTLPPTAISDTTSRYGFADSCMTAAHQFKHILRASAAAAAAAATAAVCRGRRRLLEVEDSLLHTAAIQGLKLAFASNGYLQDPLDNGRHRHTVDGKTAGNGLHGHLPAPLKLLCCSTPSWSWTRTCL